MSHPLTPSFKELIELMLAGQLSPDQSMLLAEMVDRPQYKEELEAMLHESYYHNADRTEESPEVSRRFLESIRLRMGAANPAIDVDLREAVATEPLAGQEAVPAESPEGQEAAPIRFIGRRGLRRVAAAAVLLLCVAGAWLLRPKSQAPMPVAAVPAKDVLPGGDKAILVLADKTTIALDSASSHALASQGQTTIYKMGHSLVYKPVAGSAPNPGMLFNTIMTPTGGQYHLVLSDGTKVWLDSKSSLRFPAAFGSGSREVEMSGQVYFEVADDAAHPFLVQVGAQTVTVLGTHFNVNAFPEEGPVRTTLVEGAVKVEAAGHGLLLHPGQQASGSRQLIGDPDMEATLAWKDGVFRFNSASLPAIMRQLSRWYGIDVTYKDSIRASFVADIPREAPLSEVLKLLELTKHVHFEIENKQVTVMKN